MAIISGQPIKEPSELRPISETQQVTPKQSETVKTPPKTPVTLPIKDQITLGEDPKLLAMNTIIDQTVESHIENREGQIQSTLQNLSTEQRQQLLPTLSPPPDEIVEQLIGERAKVVGDDPEESRLVSDMKQQFKSEVKDDPADLIFNPRKSKDFAKFAEKNLSLENIDFMKEMKKAVEAKPVSIEKLKQICTTFIGSASPRQINLPFKMNKDIAQALAKQPPVLKKLLGALQPAVTEITKLIRLDTVPKFKKTEEFKALDAYDKLTPKDMSTQLLSELNSQKSYDTMFLVFNPKTENSFYDFVKSKFGEENIDFLKDAKTALTKNPPTIEDIKGLYDKFIDPDAETPVNLDSSTVNGIKKALSMDPPDIKEALDALKPAISEIKKLIGDNYSTSFMDKTGKQIRTLDDTEAPRKAILASLQKGEGKGLAEKMNSFINAIEAMKDAFPEDYTRAKTVMNNLSDSLAMLSQSPMGKAESELYLSNLNTVRRNLSMLKASLAGLDSKSPALADPALRAILSVEIDNQMAKLEQKGNYVASHIFDDPRTMKDIFKAKSLDTRSALNLLNDKIGELRTSGKKDTDKEMVPLLKTKVMLEARIDKFMSETSVEIPSNLKDIMGNTKAGYFAKKGATNKTISEFESGQIRPYSKNLSEEAIMKIVLKETFKNAGIEVNDDHLKKELHHKHIQVLNDRQWEPVSKDILISHNGQMKTYKSEQLPANRMGQTFSSYNGKGICCHTTNETTHAVNLWKSQLKDGDQVLFSGIRHGVHSAYGIKDEQTRLNANISRAEETIKSVIVTNETLMAKAMTLKEGETLEFDMSSISLVTPDSIRSISGDLAPDNEKHMLAEQLNAWRHFSNEPRQITIKDSEGHDKTITIKPTILTFNFGVNAGAVNWYSGIAGGWGTAKETNDASMRVLFGNVNESGQIQGKEGKVGAYIAKLKEQIDNPLTAEPEKVKLRQKLQNINELADQITGIYNTEAYKTSGEDPYKIVSRLAVLTHMMDSTPLWNCKSGKDRTGELDVEAKFIASQIQLTGHVPPYDRPLTKPQTEALREITKNSGNLEVQELNVGGGGFKLEGVSALAKRLGGNIAKLFHTGLSKFFKS